MFKWLYKFEKIFIIGECPSWIKNVIHVPATDQHKNNSARNIYEKILKACNHPDISDHFFYSADDSFLLKGLSHKGYPYFRSGNIEEVLRHLGKNSYYKPYVQSTLGALQSRKLPTTNFDIHIPIIYHKDIYREVMGDYNWETTKGYTSKTLYANSLKIPGILLKDCKIHVSKTKPAIYRHINGSRFFSTHFHAINAYMIDVFSELYPQKSPVEL
jgi:hypothetical protein